MNDILLQRGHKNSKAINFFIFIYIYLFIFRKGGRKEGRKGRGKEGREGGRERREGRKSSNERDIGDLDLEVYKLISFSSFFERRKEKKGVKERKKEEEKEGERMEMLLYSKKYGY